MLNFPSPPNLSAAEQLRSEVRNFLATTIARRTPLQRAESWNGFDREFSRALGTRGWLGMTWPKQYGGHERSAFERYVVIEETLAAGAPVSAHWIAERQSGPSLLKYGSEQQKAEILPRIVAGDCVFCIGMSEPDSGSDLAATRTRAEPVAGGWRVRGTKLWTTNAHEADYMILFCRTSGTTADRKNGTSQLLVDMKATEGVSVRPIPDLAGQHHFNEVHFENAFLPSTALIGTEGEGWSQVMSELAFERSGPERFLSSIELLVQLLRALQGSKSEQARMAIGRLTAHLLTLRRMSRSITTLLDDGRDASIQAAIVKDLGAGFEQAVPEIARTLIEAEPDRQSTQDVVAVLAYSMMSAPSFSLRGGYA
jgi:alkylation response protein AidB-like acyl-CoA dehydrogenase